MTKTIINSNVEREVVGYMVNTGFSEENQMRISEIQEHLTDAFGDAIWITPPKSLHITLLDWIAPLVNYESDKDELFSQIYDHYDKVMSRAIESEHIIGIQFETVEASPAAIILRGQDNGEFERIRKEYLNNVTLLPGTKLPPKIIHSTLARFTKEIDLEQIQEYVQQLTVSFNQSIEGFRLIKETLDPLLEFQVIKSYTLSK